MTKVIEAALRHAVDNKKRYEDMLSAFCVIPSISTLPVHRDDMRRCGEWLAHAMRKLGVEDARLWETGGHPAVCGSLCEAPGRPVLLVYGHYDVQPVDPLTEWDSQPFEPTVRGDNLFARGASDNKGQIIALLAALEAIRVTGPLPVNLKFLFEGEEESGSANLDAFIAANKAMLACDGILNCDGGIASPDQPAISYGLRGLAYFEVEARGPSNDLHSGVWGGVVHNPIQALCELITGMHDADGHVTLPGFYDSVLIPDAKERALLAKAPLTDDVVRAVTGVPEIYGEKGWANNERVGVRPTLEVNGIWGGFTGEGAKTVLPAKATAKISMRLVPNQDHKAIGAMLRAYMTAHAPATVTWEIRELHGGPWAIMRRDSQWTKAAVKALEATFNREVLFKREGGSIPVVSALQEELGVDCAVLGFELPDAGYHGPNEKMHIPTFHKGIETYIRFMHLA